MSRLLNLARAVRAAINPAPATQRRTETQRDTLEYQKAVLRYLYERRTSLHGGWVSVSEVSEQVGRLYFDAQAALNALVCDGMAEREGSLFRSRGVPATPGRSNVIPFPTRTNLRAYSTILGDRGIGALA